jgi:hypothetical protein
MFRKGGMAQREKYMGGGMTGIMSGIVPDAGVTPRVGLQEGTFIRGGGVTQGPPFSTRGIPVRLPATTPPVPALIPQGPPVPPGGTGRFAGILRRLKNIPGAAKLVGLSRFSPYAAAAATGTGIAQLADFFTKSTDTPEAYAFRKEATEANPFLFDETSTDEFIEFSKELRDKDQGEKYGFFPRGGKEQRLKDLGLDDQFDAKTGKRIKGTTTKDKSEIENIPAPDKKEDPEKSLMDVYDENKGIIDQVMGNADEDTKKSMYLQLAKFGAGLLAQPGGDLVGAIGKAAEKPLEGAEATLAEKRKGERDTKLLALQKTFDDMKEPEQIKLVKAIQKEYGFDTFAEAYDFISKPKKSSAEIRADDEALRKIGENMGVSSEGFKNEMKKLEGTKFEDLIGVLSRNDALLPKDPDDRTNYEYYIRPDGKPVRFVDGVLYEPEDPEFIKPIPTTET